MKPTAFAALAALVAVARMASAQATGSPDAVAEAGVRATTEARALVATMQHNSWIALEALETARTHRRADEIRCADEALSRADVALRRAREDAASLEAAVASRDELTTSGLVARLRTRAGTSREAQVTAVGCTMPEASRQTDRTLITVRVDPRIARIEP